MGRTLNRGREGLSIDCDSNWSLPAPALPPPAHSPWFTRAITHGRNKQSHQHHNATLPLVLYSGGADVAVFSDARSTKF